MIDRSRPLAFSRALPRRRTADANTVNILLGNGKGIFAAKVDYATGAYSFGVAVGDFNADGKPDLAAANTNARTVSILLNGCQ